MPIRPESWGGKHRIPVLAVALILAMTVEPVDGLTPEGTPNPVKYGRIRKRVEPPKKTHHLRHVREHLTPEEIAARQVTPEEFAAWSKVAVCEEGGDWHVEGSEYSGGLGISTDNWVAYGGEFFAPTGAQATPQEQIVVAERIQPDPPDQYGCSGSW